MEVPKEERKPDVEEIADFIHPVSKYILWAAINNEGPYKQEEQKVDLIFEEDFLLFPKGYKSADELNFMDAAERQTFRDAQTCVKDFARAISQHLKEVQKHKCDFLRELHSLERVLQQEVYSRLSTESIDAFTNWIESVATCINKIERI
eukprot:TRINITY_DN7963_c0_g1_i4.p1 TRINITY_DN7963_c0_g1~~TRINITY_DN7963_c0_g1_i4.p1  ORF type:complete len:149 (-),score=48.76 TRINITY_DN7963_c0_g1_i4:173-619(-)